MAKILLRCSDELASELDAEAKRAGMSRNRIMEALLGDGLVAAARERLEGEKPPTEKPRQIRALTSQGASYEDEEREVKPYTKEQQARGRR